jgi:hypothetical protein
VPIEAGPPPMPESSPPPETVEVMTMAEPVDQVETAAVQPEPPPVPANDVVAGPLVQPIVIGSESTPPPERKRGWWRRG